MMRRGLELLFVTSLLLGCVTPATIAPQPSAIPVLPTAAPQTTTPVPPTATAVAPAPTATPVLPTPSPVPPTSTPEPVIGPGNVGLLREQIAWRPEGGEMLEHVTWSPDGGALAVVSLGGRGTLGDLLRQEVVFTVTGVTSTLVFSPDGSQLAAGVGNDAVRLWDAATGRELRTLSPHPSKVQGVAYSPDGAQLFAASTYGPFKLWEVVTGRVITDTGYAATGVIRAAFSPDGRLLAMGECGSRGLGVELWELSPMQRVAVLPNDMIDDIYGLAWSPDGARLATGSLFGIVRIWDVASAQRLVQVRLQGASAEGVSWSPDGRLLAVAAGSQGTKLLDASTGEELYTLPGSAESEAWDVAFSPDGRSLATASRDGVARVWGLP